MTTRAPTAAIDKATFMAARIEESRLVIPAYEPESTDDLSSARQSRYGFESLATYEESLPDPLLVG